jgi:hypothetical protein
MYIIDSSARGRVSSRTTIKHNSRVDRPISRIYKSSQVLNTRTKLPYDKTKIAKRGVDLSKF